ncbi:MAG: RNA polymerase subunit sigma-70 [Alphaproteobacteria bacterium HGW-Alphaproteobacteria-5]|nr:MAG: RNA polymerase subunit sigma-70 [Alphaproteobacteria bacterium HGW-Alphaproteobacteria-5]
MTEAQLDGMKQNPAPDALDEALRPLDPVIETALSENRRAFLQFLVRRLGDQSAAEDVLQSFCLRAVSRGAGLRDSESVVGWLYTVLRSVLMDHYRSEAARRRREAGYAQEQVLLGNDCDDLELEESVCNCFRGLLPALRPDYAEVLRRIDLSGETREKVAADLGITLTNVRVRLHRARQALRNALGKCCGNCCEHGFRDCSCKSAHDGTVLAPSREAALI